MIEEHEDDFEGYDEEIPTYGEQIDILLLEPCNGGKMGDIIKVYRGMYNTLINLKKGLPVDGYEDGLDDRQRLVITIKNLEEKIKEYMEENAKLWEKNLKLKADLNELENN